MASLVQEVLWSFVCKWPYKLDYSCGVSVVSEGTVSISWMSTIPLILAG